MNGMWDIFFLSDPHKQERKWDIFIQEYLFPLYYVKIYVKILQKYSKVDRYVVHKLTWSGVDLRRTFSNDLPQKVLKLVPMTATGTDVYVTTMDKFISYY